MGLLVRLNLGWGPAASVLLTRKLTVPAELLHDKQFGLYAPTQTGTWGFSRVAAIRRSSP